MAVWSDDIIGDIRDKDLQGRSQTIDSGVNGLSRSEPSSTETIFLPFGLCFALYACVLVNLFFVFFFQ